MKESLKGTVQRIFNYSAENDITIHIAYEQLMDLIERGELSACNIHQLKEARQFADKYYNEIVEARKNGDFTELDKLW